MEVNVIGGGLAGSEAAYQLLKRNVKVNLYEMKPLKFSEAHKDKNFAELVCSNSLKSESYFSASGLLKSELKKLDSLLINTAIECRVPAGSALAVDRELFAANVTQKLKSYPNLNIIEGEVEKLPNNLPTIIATGPLTSDKFSKTISQLVGGDQLFFFDAIAPIVSLSTVDADSSFVQDRYDRGDGDYVNCPLNKEEYLSFHENLVSAERVQLKDFENATVFEGCMPIEVLASRGVDAIRFGPLKPVGLVGKDGKRPYAVVQLRKESNFNDLYNLVGFQTNLTYGEQKRVFSLIPALKNAEFFRFGTMHKNTYINSPKCLNKHFQFKDTNVFFAGQISGVEGYVESIASGLMSALNMYQLLQGLPLIDFGKTMLGALAEYISTCQNAFQPMSANMGLVNFDNYQNKSKTDKNMFLADRCLENLDKTLEIYKVMI